MKRFSMRQLLLVVGGRISCAEFYYGTYKVFECQSELSKKWDLRRRRGFFTFSYVINKLSHYYYSFLHHQRQRRRPIEVVDCLILHHQFLTQSQRKEKKKNQITISTHHQQNSASFYTATEN